MSDRHIPTEEESRAELKMRLICCEIEREDNEGS